MPRFDGSGILILFINSFCLLRLREFLSIPLSCRLPEDKLCWDLDKEGSYSVHSVYKATLYDERSMDKEGSYLVHYPLLFHICSPSFGVLMYCRE